jgi:hypothetical protein
LPFSSNNRSPSSIAVVVRHVRGHEDLRQIEMRRRAFVEHLGVVAEPDRLVCELHRFLDVARRASTFARVARQSICETTSSLAAAVSLTFVTSRASS